MISTKKLPKKVTMHLLRTVYAQLDSLLDELTEGKEWRDTVYHFFFSYTEAEIKARFHQINTTAIEFYKLLGKPIPTLSYKDQAEDEMIREIQKTASTPHDELIGLILYTLSTTSLYGLYYQPHDVHTTYFVHVPKLDKFSAAAYEEVGLSFTKAMTQTSIIREKQPLISQVDLSPIYRALFAALRETGYRWKYHNLPLEALMNIHIDPQMDTQDLEDITMHVLSDLADTTGNFDITGTTDQIFAQMQQEVPPDILVAYFDVFKQWPPGYPPKKEDYIYH